MDSWDSATTAVSDRKAAHYGARNTTVATAPINWNALYKIILAALAGGTGVVILFGLLLLGISRRRTASNPTTRYAPFALSGLCGVGVRS